MKKWCWQCYVIWCLTIIIAWFAGAGQFPHSPYLAALLVMAFIHYYIRKQNSGVD